MSKIDDLLAQDGASWRRSVDAAVTRDQQADGDAAPPLAVQPAGRRGRVAVWGSVAAIAVVAAVIGAAIALTHDDNQDHGTNRPASGHAGLPTPVISDPLTATVAPRHPYPAATLISPRQAAGMQTSMRWVLRGMNTSRTHLYITFVAGGGCTTPGGLYVTQTPRYVLIASLGYGHFSPDAVCPTNLINGSGTVILSQPLGTRPLLHAAVGAWHNPAYLHQPRPHASTPTQPSQPSVSTTPPPSGPIARCTLTHLRIHGPLAVTPNMAAGVAFYLRLTNTGTTACSLQGWPDVTVLNREHAPTATRVFKRYQDTAWRYRVKEIDLAPGAAAATSFFVPATRTTSCDQPYYFKVSLHRQPGTRSLYDPNNYVAMCTTIHTDIAVSPFHQLGSHP